LDNLTHTLFGATLGRAAFPRVGRGTTAALLLASNAPDVDIVTTAGGALNYLRWHRGPTHGPLGVVGLGVVCAGIVWLWQRTVDRHHRSDHASYVGLFLVAVAGVTAHILMDLPTSYGTRLLSPFDWHWYAADLMPIIDIYLLVVLAAGLMLGRVRPAIRRQAACLVLAFMAANYVARGLAHQRAVQTAESLMGPEAPPRCAGAVSETLFDRWPLPGTAARHALGASRCLVEVAAVPTFFSPFQWQIIARLSDGYRMLTVDLLTDGNHPRDGRDAPWRAAVPHPDQWTPSVMRAAESELGRVFLGFSRFPATRSIVNEDHSAEVRWVDLRFVQGPARRPGARRGIFSAMVLLAPDGRIVSEQLGE